MIDAWLNRWRGCIPALAAAELHAALDPAAHTIADDSGGSEARVQSGARRIASAEFAVPLWRNNNGAMTTDDGRHVRFGLGNDSAGLNRKWKSSDLIGIRPVEINGTTIGQFVAVEVKRPGWRMTPSDKRVQAQAAFMKSVVAFGGRAGFVQSDDDLRRLLSNA